MADKKRSIGRWMVASGVLLRPAVSIAFILCASAAKAESPAGSRIRNTATLAFTARNIGGTAASNQVDLLVAEQLDVAIGRGLDAESGAADNRTIAVVVVNGGNGREAFAIVTDDPAGATIAVDRDGDGRFDPAVDRVLPDGLTPLLAPGASERLLVNSRRARTETLTIIASAVTGSGTTGTTFAGKGDGGSDAVVGRSGASARLVVPPASGRIEPTLVKSQTVRAPDGTDRPVRGAIVTYTLAAHFAAATTRVGLVDPIPSGTAYVPGSLRLETQSLTDGADADAGQADDRAVRIDLGDIAAPGNRTVQFQVTIR